MEASQQIDPADPDWKIVLEVAARRKLQGTPQQWYQAYKAEVDKVKNLRLKEVTGTEYERVLKEEIVVRIMMRYEYTAATDRYK